MRQHPHVYEINTLPFLTQLRHTYQRPLTLSSIPEKEWADIARKGFDFVWLMGVWERSPASRREALTNPELRAAFTSALPDWTEDDVVGSPYAVHRYALDPTLGDGDEELSALRDTFHRLGMGLMLDFVPNHVARDHPWTLAHPDWFIRADRERLSDRSDVFFSPDGTNYLAHGTDPYFPPWTDTAQLNFYSDAMRAALIDELSRIAARSDAVRCDMAMLALNTVFQQTWGWAVQTPSMPQHEFWSDAIGRIKQDRNDYCFLAEVYWGLDRVLLEMGFDFAYDKTLYDKLVASSPMEIRSHIEADLGYQRHLARFIENHDELRAVTAFGEARSRAAAVVMSTIPGLRLFHHGQVDGRRIRLPLQLRREPDEAPNPEMARFYHRVLSIIDEPAFHGSTWTVLDVQAAAPGDSSYRHLLAWCWQDGEETTIVIVNYSRMDSRGSILLPMSVSPQAIVEIVDEFDRSHSRQTELELVGPGLSVHLAPWRFHIFTVRQQTSTS